MVQPLQVYLHQAEAVLKDQLPALYLLFELLSSLAVEELRKLELDVRSRMLSGPAMPGWRRRPPLLHCCHLQRQANTEAGVCFELMLRSNGLLLTNFGAYAKGVGIVLRLCREALTRCQ